MSRRYEEVAQGNRRKAEEEFRVGARRMMNGSIEMPRLGQVHHHSFLETDVISPVTVSKGLRESQDVSHFPDTEEPSAVRAEEQREERVAEAKKVEREEVLTEPRESVVVLNSVK